MAGRPDLLVARKVAELDRHIVELRTLLLSTKDLPKVWRHREQRRSIRSL
jgi:hypothetical protein